MQCLILVFFVIYLNSWGYIGWGPLSGILKVSFSLFFSSFSFFFLIFFLSLSLSGGGGLQLQGPWTSSTHATQSLRHWHPLINLKRFCVLLCQILPYHVFFFLLSSFHKLYTKLYTIVKKEKRRRRKEKRKKEHHIRLYTLDQSFTKIEQIGSKAKSIREH